MATDESRPDGVRPSPQGAGVPVSHWDGRADVSASREADIGAEGVGAEGVGEGGVGEEAGEPIRWWNDGELPLVGRGVDGMIYVVSTFLPPGCSVSSVGCVRGPSLTDVLAVFGRGVCQSVTPAFWVSRDDYPGGSLRQGVIAHKSRAEEAARSVRPP
jgi:hypothetical protein